MLWSIVLKNVKRRIAFQLIVLFEAGSIGLDRGSGADEVTTYQTRSKSSDGVGRTLADDLRNSALGLCRGCDKMMAD